MSELSKQELVELVMIWAEKLPEATSADDERMTMRHVFEYALSYGLIVAKERQNDHSLSP